MFVERLGKKQVKAATVGRRRSITECIEKYMAVRRVGGDLRNTGVRFWPCMFQHVQERGTRCCRQEGRRSITHRSYKKRELTGLLLSTRKEKPTFEISQSSEELEVQPFEIIEVQARKYLDLTRAVRNGRYVLIHITKYPYTILSRTL